MTENKPIMIDGVDVAGCEFHSSTPCSELCYMKGNKCNDNSNCYYKQLQRKTQECKELKKVNRHIDHNRIQKANKLMQIEKIIIACQSGYTDEFIQSLLEILLAAESD